jgi:hypothetical protein
MSICLFVCLLTTNTQYTAHYDKLPEYDVLSNELYSLNELLLALMAQLVLVSR